MNVLLSCGTHPYFTLIGSARRAEALFERFGGLPPTGMSIIRLEKAFDDG
jgi:hypothetical protein